MTGATFASVAVLTIEIDEANTVFGYCGDFVVNFEANSLVRYVGSEDEVLIENQFSGIAAGCFANLSRLSAIQFEAGSQISFFGTTSFFACMGLQSFSIPSTVETIPAQCFESCRALRNVTFESGSRVSVIGDRAFAFCRSLASICIPSSVTKIGPNCFVLCMNLAAVTVESGGRVSDIGAGAFLRCSSSLRLPTALTGRL
jgi:hypothetical protein